MNINDCISYVLDMIRLSVCVILIFCASPQYHENGNIGCKFVCSCRLESLESCSTVQTQYYCFVDDIFGVLASTDGV